MDQIFLGIDGGGTKTRCAIAHETGKIIGLGLAGGCKDDKYTTLKMAQQNVNSAVAAAINEAGIGLEDITTACFGIPGLNSRDNFKKARQLTKFTDLKGRVLIEPDTKIAWAGALVCRPGVVVVSGNGFDVYGVSKSGENMKGLGPKGPIILFGESCEDLEHRILYECLVANEPSPMLVKVLELIGMRTQEAWIVKTQEQKFSWGKYRGALLPLAVEAAQEGDESALHIFQEAGRTLGLAAIMTIKYLQIRETEVSFIGGAFEICGHLLFRPFRDVVSSRSPGSTIVFPRLKPIAGALLLAMRAHWQKD